MSTSTEVVRDAGLARVSSKRTTNKYTLVNHHHESDDEAQLEESVRFDAYPRIAIWFVTPVDFAFVINALDKTRLTK